MHMRAADLGGNPCRHLATAPKPTVRRRRRDNLGQRRQLRRVQKRSRPLVAPPPVAKSLRAFRVVPLRQLLDPPPRVTRRRRTLGNPHALRQMPHHLIVAAQHPIRRQSIALIKLGRFKMTRKFQLPHHKSPHPCNSPYGESQNMGINQEDSA